MRLWVDENADAFVLAEYPGLFRLYRSYDQEIQRSNVLRYLVLHHNGEIYIDLDLRCRVPLHPFLNESFVTPPASPTGVNNAFIVATPRHPFLEHLISHLKVYHLGWFGGPYVTNMMSTGCHFFSTMHLTYPRRRETDMKILPWSYRLNGAVKTKVFEHLGASSWHKGDTAFILALGRVTERWKPILPLFSLSLGLICVLGAVLGVSRSTREWGHRRVRSISRRPLLQIKTLAIGTIVGSPTESRTSSPRRSQSSPAGAIEDDVDAVREFGWEEEKDESHLV